MVWFILAVISVIIATVFGVAFVTNLEDWRHYREKRCFVYLSVCLLFLCFATFSFIGTKRSIESNAIEKCLFNEYVTIEKVVDDCVVRRTYRVAKIDYD